MTTSEPILRLQNLKKYFPILNVWKRRTGWLKALDDVAYVRFASVYKNFREAKDFEALLGELSGPVADDDEIDSDDPDALDDAWRAHIIEH